IEVRLCAEDPERGFLPTTGRLLAADVPATVRADLGVVAGSEIGIHYDSMLGKLIAHAPTRAEAAQVLRRALDETWVPGLVAYRCDASAVDVSIGGKTTRIASYGVDADRVWFVEHGSHRRTARVITSGARVWVLADGALYALDEQPRFPEHVEQAVAGGLV